VNRVVIKKGAAMETKRIKPTFGEWCILIGLLGLIAAAIRPAASQAVEEQKLSNLVGRLHEIRAGIALYKADHAGLYPGQRHFGGNIDPGLFVQDLTTADGIGKRAYLSLMPSNPYLEGQVFAGRVFCVNDPLAKPCVGTEAGWWFNAATGQFCALDSEFHMQY
jgi:type II secretory pathway pseudopilin PulG